MPSKYNIKKGGSALIKSRAKPITKKQEEQVLSLQGKMKAEDISKHVGVTIHQVYGTFRRNKTTNQQNQIVKISKVEEQILLGGLIGDGHLKRNGKNNYYYSECHSLSEVGYLKRKHSMLGELTANSSIYEKNFNNEHSKAMEFTSKTTPSLIKYAEMSEQEIMSRLTELGLVVLILDDGWYRSNLKLGGIGLTNKNIKLLDMFIKQCKEVFGITPYKVGVKRIDVSIRSEDIEPILKTLQKYNMLEIDVVEKKFKTFKEYYGY